MSAARDRPRRRRAADRRDRDLLALRPLGDRDDRPDRPHRRPADHARRLRDLPARGDRRAACSPSARSPGSGDLLHGAGGRAAYRGRGRRSRCSRPSSRPAGRGSCPQIRRQLPEHWRRVMPMPVAAALYGVLLGTRLHDLRPLLRRLGARRGQPGGRRPVARPAGRAPRFGIGRAIPIVVLAPLAGSATGIRATELMCERAGVYLGLRRGDAAALLLAAARADRRARQRGRRAAPMSRTPPIRPPRPTRCSSSGSAARR